MKNKKTIALAMAAATVAPVAMPAVEVFAAEQKSLAGHTMDFRLSNGYELKKEGSEIKVYSRKEAFDQNGTDYISDDVLKETLGEGAKVVAVFDNGTKTVEDDKYVIAVKASKTDVESAKIKLDAAIEEINELKAAGYKTSIVETPANLTATTFTEGKVVVTAKLGTVTKVFTFTGIEDLKAEETSLTLFNDLFNKKYEKATVNTSDRTIVLDVNKLMSSLDKYYDDLNKIKYTIEQNSSKFEIEKEEINYNKDLRIVIYQKGAKGIENGRVLTLLIDNFADLNKDLIIDMPSKTDIDGHWAESEIKDAMLLGHIDASSTFRPKDGITRAEFAKMLCTVLDIDASKAVASYEEPFHDVKSSDWYYKYIVALYNNYGKSEKASAAQKGAIINGYEGDLFKPNAKITRQEAAKMLAAAYEVYNGLALTVNYNSQDKANGFEKSDITSKIDGIVDMTRKVNQETMHRDIKTSYVDDKDIASWADESVQTLKEEGIAGGNPDGTFKPKSDINRVEALLMIQRLAKQPVR